MIRILIVDDRAVVRQELRNVLTLSGLVQVVGEAVNGRDAVRQAEMLHPEIVLMDLEMPDLDGFKATRLIKERGLARQVIIFTVYADPAYQQRAFEAGADAFIVKGAPLNTLFDWFERFPNSTEQS